MDILLKYAHFRAWRAVSPRLRRAAADANLQHAAATEHRPPNLFDSGMQLSQFRNNLCKDVTGLVPLPPSVDQTFPPGGVNGATSPGAIVIPAPPGSADPDAMAKFVAWGTRCSDPATASTARPLASLPLSYQRCV
jgi:hypothetical protein